MKVNGYKISAGLVFLLAFSLCATTSVLYPFCDESHCFFTVGKAMLHGRVLYKDILECKGLLIYLLQIPAYWISHRDSNGVFMIQLVLMAISAHYIFEIADNILHSNKKSFLVTVLFALFAFTTKAIASAQIVEVYLLPCFLYTFYSLIRYGYNHRSVFLVNGILSGIIFWIKYSLLGFYVGYVLFFVVVSLTRKDDSRVRLKELLAGLLLYGLGIVLVTLPCIGYFAANSALNELWNYYIAANINSYGSAITPAGVIAGYAAVIKANIINEPLLTLLLVLSIYSVYKLLDLAKALAVTSCFLFSFLIVFLHGNMFNYYFYALVPFIVFALIWTVDRLTSRFEVKRLSLAAAGLSVLFLCSVFRPFPRGFLRETEELAQYRFAEYMHSVKENPTALNYGFLDAGFYTVADIVPNIWAFCRINQDIPGALDDQRHAIRDKKVDFVITRMPYGKEPRLLNILKKNYSLVESVSQYLNDDMYTYYLYELNSRLARESCARIP